MATTVNNDLVIYDDLAQTAFLERRQDNLEVFNASSNGAILLDNELIEGDFRKRAFYKVGGSIESRNVNSVDKVTGKKIGAGEAVSVKAPWKYGPYETTEEAFKRRGRSVDEFSEVIGVDVADATLEGYVKYGLKALTAAIGANADMVVTADIETDGKKTLTRGLRKYGDKFNRVVLFVMHSATYFDIVDEAIANKIYEEAGVVVYGGQPGTLGKPVLVTDTMDADAILGLVAGAVTVTRKGSVTVIGGVEHKTEEVRFTAVGVKTEYAPGEIDGTVIVNGDVQIVFTSEQEIKIGDVVDIDGTAYRIVNPNPAKPASLVLCYKAQLRA